MFGTQPEKKTTEKVFFTEMVDNQVLLFSMLSRTGRRSGGKAEGVGDSVKETILDSKGKGAYREREEGSRSGYPWLFASTVREASHLRRR